MGNDMTYHGAQARIVDGYSFTTTDGLLVYGVAPNEVVRVIGFGHDNDIAPDSKSIDCIKALAQNYNLDLVNWCRCIRVAPVDPSFASLLATDSS